MSSEASTVLWLIIMLGELIGFIIRVREVRAELRAKRQGAQKDASQDKGSD